MKIVPIDTTSDALKARLIATAEKLKIRPSAQANHKIVAAQIALDILGISEPATREGFIAVWDALPASFPCNASAVNKALELETEKAKLEKVFAGL